MDIKLTDTDDLDLSTGDFQLISGLDEMRQVILISLRTFLGEWFLDTRIGAPWYEEILGQKPNLPVVQAFIENVLLAVPGVTQVLNLEADYIGATRVLTVSFDAITTEGTVVFDRELII